MISCPGCATRNIEGTFFCDDCGAPLIGVDGLATQHISSGNLPKTAQMAFSNVMAPGTVSLRSTAEISIHFSDTHELVNLAPDSEIVLGREDESANSFPDIDLTPYGALDSGVSRAHASLRRGEDTLTLTDLDSANGTYLNGRKITAYHPNIVRDGDEVRFGKLVSRIYFK